MTVNGKAKLVIQDAQAYENMVKLLSTLETIAQSAKEFDEGKGINIDTFFADFERRHGLKND